MADDEDDHSRVKQAVNNEDTAEQPSIKINVPQALEADIQVEEEEDLETVLANLELLARRQGFDTDVLSRSVEDQGQQEVLPEADKDLLGWLQQLDENLGTVEDHLQALDKRVDRVEDELGGGEDSQLGEVMDRIRELEESLEELPKDVSRHLGEIRDQVRELEEYVDDVEDEVENLNQQFTESHGETREEEASEKQAEQEDDVDESEDEEDTTESDTIDQEEDEAAEGLFRSVSAFRNLSTEQRADEIKQVIRENQPIGTSGICRKLFGYKAKSGTDAYTAVQNAMQDFRDELEKEKDGRSRKYRVPESEYQDSSESSEAESETATEVEEDETPQTKVSEKPEAPQPEPTEAGEVLEPEDDSTDSDRPDLSDSDGRYSLEELREDEDLSLEAEVLKVFQEYRKSHGPISIPEATKVLFGFRASAEDEEYQAVWNELSDHKAKDGDRVERLEKKEEEDQFKIFGPFKYCNLYSDSHHSIICTECPPGEDAIYRDMNEAATHLGETGKADGKKRHNAFVSAQLPQSSWYRNTKLIKKVVDRECGNQ